MPDSPRPRLQRRCDVVFWLENPPFLTRLRRDATVLALLGEVSAATALALGNLRRQGFAVTAVLVVFEPGALEIATGRLLAESIDVRYLKNEAELPGLCQRQMLR